MKCYDSPNRFGDRYFWGHNLYFLHNSRSSQKGRKGKKINGPQQKWGDHCIKFDCPAVPSAQNPTENYQQAKKSWTCQNGCCQVCTEKITQDPLATICDLGSPSRFTANQSSKLGDRWGDATSRCLTAHDIKAGSLAPRKGTKTRQTKQNEKNYWKADTRYKKHESLRSLHLGTTSPSSWLQNCLPCSSSESWGLQRVSQAAARQWRTGAGHQGDSEAPDPVLAQVPPSAHVAFLHSAPLNEASLIKGPCWFKKILIKIWPPLSSILQDPYMQYVPM